MASIINNEINSQNKDNDEQTKPIKSKDNKNFSSFLLSWIFKNIKLCGIRLLYCMYNSKIYLKKAYQLFSTI